MCVQKFDDSLNSAIRVTYRISLRSSSMPEPRDPLLKVLCIVYICSDIRDEPGWGGRWAGRGARQSNGPVRHRVEVGGRAPPGGDMVPPVSR